jgi:hypothetical protein
MTYNYSGCRLDHESIDCFVTMLKEKSNRSVGRLSFLEALQVNVNCITMPLHGWRHSY